MDKFRLSILLLWLILIGVPIFILVFTFLLLMTINAFTGGTLLSGQSKETSAKEYYLGENSYGKMYYTGEIAGGQLVGSGILSIKNTNYNIELNGIFQNNTFKSGTVSITDYNNKYNFTTSGEFDGNNAYKSIFRFEDTNSNVVLYGGDATNGELDGFADAYYLLPSINKTIHKAGNFSNGKLITVLINEEAPFSSEVTE